MHTLIKGIVGSVAYGLHTDNSDTDYLGVYAIDTEKLFGLDKPDETRVTKDPDTTMHEAAKYCRLALQCNPTILELMWLPDNLIVHKTPLGLGLRLIRAHFLSATRVRNSYFGYAEQQFHRLMRRGDGTSSADTRKRTAKHARHMARLLWQGNKLYATGDLPIEVPDAQELHDFGRAVADGDLHQAKTMLGQYEISFDANPTVLPAKPNLTPIREWLNTVRMQHLTL